MAKKLKNAYKHLKAAVRLIITEDLAAFYVVSSVFKKFLLIPVYVKKNFRDNHFQRSLNMTAKTFTIIIGVLLVISVAYIAADQRPYQDRPVVAQPGPRQEYGVPDRPFAEGVVGPRGPVLRPAQPIQSLSVWFEAVKQAYINGNQQRVGNLIQRMDNILAQQGPEVKNRSVVQTFERWFIQFKNAHQMGEVQRMGQLIKRYGQASEQVRGAVQQPLGQPQQQRPIQPAGPRARIRGSQPQQQVPPAGQPGAGFGRRLGARRGQPLEPAGPAQRDVGPSQRQQLQPVGSGPGLGRDVRGGRDQLRGQILIPQRPLPRGWGWRIDIRPLPPLRQRGPAAVRPRLGQPEPGAPGQPLQPQRGRGAGPGRGGPGLGRGPALRGQVPQPDAPIVPQGRRLPRPDLAPEARIRTQPQRDFIWD